MSTTAAAYVTRSPWFCGRWCVPRPMPRPVTTRALDTLDAATRGVQFAASVAAFEHAEPTRVRDVPLAEFVRIELRRVRELVHHPFQREERRRIHRRAQRTGSQIPGARHAVVDDPPIRTSYMSVCDRCTEKSPPPRTRSRPPGRRQPAAACQARAATPYRAMPSRATTPDTRSATSLPSASTAARTSESSAGP